MTTRNEKLQAIWHHYESSRGHQPTGTREAVEWAVAEGLLRLPDIDPLDILAGQMADALHEEVQTDSRGRRFRVNHAVRVTKGGAQYTFWGVMGFAPHDHMEKAFGQRRDQIIGDCVRLRTDVDVYNDMIRGQHRTMRLVLDFTDDVAERLLAGT